MRSNWDCDTLRKYFQTEVFKQALVQHEGPIGADLLRAGTFKAAHRQAGETGVRVQYCLCVCVCSCMQVHLHVTLWERQTRPVNDCYSALYCGKNMRLITFERAWVRSPAARVPLCHCSA